jgi:hypothetical protein
MAQRILEVEGSACEISDKREERLVAVSVSRISLTPILWGITRGGETVREEFVKNLRTMRTVVASTCLNAS